MHQLVGKRVNERFDEPAGEDEPGEVLAILLDKSEADRQRERPVEDRQAHDDGENHPVVPIADLGLAQS